MVCRLKMMHFVKVTLYILNKAASSLKNFDLVLNNALRDCRGLLTHVTRSQRELCLCVVVKVCQSSQLCILSIVQYCVCPSHSVTWRSLHCRAKMMAVKSISRLLYRHERADPRWAIMFPFSSTAVLKTNKINDVG